MRRATGNDKQSCIWAVVVIFLSSGLFVNNAYATYIAAFGDSITRGYPVYKDDANGIVNNGGYIPKLQSKLNAVECYPPFESAAAVYNYGHPGEFVTSRGEIRAAIVLLDKPDIMLIMEGTNDLPLHIGPSAISNSLGHIVDDVLDAGAIPVLGTLLPRFDLYSFVNISGTNDLIRQLAIDEKIELAELNTASSNWNSLMVDEVHPNNSGYQLLADVWFSSVMKVRPCPEPIVVPAIYLLLLD